MVIRVRPPLPRELQGFREYQCTSLVDANSGQIITISENLPAVLSGQAPSDGLLYATYRSVIANLFGTILFVQWQCSWFGHTHTYRQLGCLPVQVVKYLLCLLTKAYE